jgi:hypothetical protein
MSLGELPRTERGDEDQELDLDDPEVRKRFPRLTALYHLHEDEDE